MSKLVICAAILVVCICAINGFTVDRKSVNKLQHFIQQLEARIQKNRQNGGQSQTGSGNGKPGKGKMGDVFTKLHNEALSEACTTIVLDNVIEAPVTAATIIQVITDLNTSLHEVHATVGFNDLGEFRRQYFCASLEAQILALRMKEFGLEFHNNQTCDMKHYDGLKFKLSKCFQDCDTIGDLLGAAFHRFHDIIGTVINVGTAGDLETIPYEHICDAGATLSRMGLRMNGMVKFLVENDMCGYEDDTPEETTGTA